MPPGAVSSSIAWILSLLQGLPSMAVMSERVTTDDLLSVSGLPPEVRLAIFSNPTEHITAYSGSMFPCAF